MSRITCLGAAKSVLFLAPFGGLVAFLASAHMANPDVAVGQDRAKDEGTVPILAAGLVTYDGKLVSLAGAKVVAEKTERGKYTVTFDRGLSSAPVVVVSAHQSLDGYPTSARTTSITKNNFKVETLHIWHGGGDRDPKLRQSGTPWDTGFHFVVIQAKERTP